MPVSISHALIQNQLRSLAGGIATAPLPDPVVVDGKSYTKTQLAAVLQASITATDAAIAAKAAATKATADAANAREAAMLLRSQLHMLLEVSAGKSSPILAQLGFTKPSTPLTVAEKSAAIDKSKATREARHTMGPKQKAMVKGVVGATVVVGTAGTPITPAVPGGSGAVAAANTTGAVTVTPVGAIGTAAAK